MARLLVTGGSGYLGAELVRTAERQGWEVEATTFSQPGRRLDVRDSDAVERLVHDLLPDAVVHTAYLQEGPDAWAVTVDGAGNVARAAAGTRLVHLSTDVVFDGLRPRRYVEGDEQTPVTDYGRAKAEAEHRVARAHPEALVVRTSMLYGGDGASKHELLALRAADGETDVTFFTDELRCPIVVGDLARALLELLSLDVSGPLHVAGADSVSRHEFARRIAAANGRDPERVRGAPSHVPRPLQCALDSNRAAQMIETRLRGVREVLPLLP